MEAMMLMIFLGVVSINAMLWKITKAQQDHYRKVESLLVELREKTASK